MSRPLAPDTSRGLLILAAVTLVAGVTASAAAEGLAFREVAAPWGLDFRHHSAATGERYMVETMSGGVVVFDYDGDGDHDLFFVDGGRLPGYDGPAPRSRLLRNDGGGRFVDATAFAGLEVAAYGNGGAAGDVDSDGDLDLYVTALGPNQLFRNLGDGRFEDVTAEAGVGDPLWGTSAAFADLDRDGDLDLYLANYIGFAVDRHRPCVDATTGLGYYCEPATYPGELDRYFENTGGGRFVDATAAAGFATGEPRAGLGVAFGDLDDDGWPDLYVANDAEPNFLFLSRGDGTVEEAGFLAGAAMSERGRAEAGMGVDLGDLDGDGRLDVVVTNFELETHALYRNLGDGLFVDGRYPLRLAEATLRELAFGVAFADFDHDADLDLVLANGHVKENASGFHPESRYAQVNQLMENRGQGRLAVVEWAGSAVERVSRGLATGDLDGDGDLEVVITNSNDIAEVYENLGGTASGSWLALDLAEPAGNRFAIGARIELEAGGGRQLREVRTASSYQSQSALTVHFGLGPAERATASVRWPEGGRQRLLELPAGRRLRLYREAAR